MASRRSSFFSKPSHIFPATSESETEQTEDLEFDEADLFHNMSLSDADHSNKKANKPSSTGLKRGSTKKVEPYGGGKSVMAPSSLPVKVPDWSKILKEDYKDRKRYNIMDNIEDFSDGDNSLRVPPHEYLARTREASHSVHEGRGRTLKGRDLRSVRNAIWKKVGFED